MSTLFKVKSIVTSAEVAPPPGAIVYLTVLSDNSSGVASWTPGESFIQV